METSLSGLRGMHASFEIADASGVAFARRGASDAAQKCGFNETDTGRLALIVTEAATNIVKHARHGELLVRELPPPGAVSGVQGAAGGVEVLALDRGPGIADVRRAFDDGRSTAGTPGTGLGAIRRLSDEMSIYSQPGLGTIVRAIVRAGSPRSGAGLADARNMLPDVTSRAASGTDIGGLCVPYPGEQVCGDAWGIEPDQHGLTVTVADGLGHGPDAHVASAGAIAAVHRRAGRPPAALMQYAHDALRSTRGAAVAIARIDLVRSVLSFSGTGNIAAAVSGASRPALVSGQFGHTSSGASSAHGERNSGRSSERSTERNNWQLTSRNGIVGHTMRDAQEFEVPWTRNAMLILHSDGIGTRWDLSAYPGLQLQPSVVIAAVLYRDFARGRDDATVVVVKADQGVHFTHGNPADTANPA
jgi:anti-sigma regulatory factor (Ser/Thr protein kinase)